MSRDTVVAFTNPNPHAPEGYEEPSLPPLGDGPTENINPPRGKATSEARPKKQWAKKVMLLGSVVGVLGGLSYAAYSTQHLWPTSATSSGAAKPDAMTLLARRVTQIEAAQTVAESRDTALQNDMTTLQHALQDVATPEQFAVLETQLESGHAHLDTRLSTLEHAQRQRIKVAARQAAAPVVIAPTLPFQVLSIDLWNDRPYVAVAASGVTELLAVGDHRAGWAVLDINRSNGQATFIHKDGTTLKRTAQDGST